MLEAIYKSRIDALSSFMQENKITVVFFEDFEHCRNPAVRYFCGQPHDALLAIRFDGKTIVSPWDINLANKMAHADKIIPFTKYKRNVLLAIEGMLKELKISSRSNIEISPTTPYPTFLRFVDHLPHFDIYCRENLCFDFVKKMRSIKDEHEIALHRKAANITNDLIDIIEQKVIAGTIKTEMDAALLIEKECRSAGCERTSFETLAAGSERSFGIHCFPSYTANPFATDGLSILDFGLVYEGYGSDVTITFAKNSNDEQEKLISLVEQAYSKAEKLYAPNIPVKEAATAVEKIFAKEKKVMPHGLGHGIGLEAHEHPFIRKDADKNILFLSGMIASLEPGLYDPVLGGVRLENDILITKDGNETLTKSRIIRL
ncbi:MAG: M24 family metallopeptidase [Treponemataceae bacterium]